MIFALGVANSSRREAAKIYRNGILGKKQSPNLIIRLYNNLHEMGTFKRKWHTATKLNEDVEKDVLTFKVADPHASVRD